MMLMVRSGTFVGDDGTIWEGGGVGGGAVAAGWLQGRGLARGRQAAVEGEATTSAVASGTKRLMWQGQGGRGTRDSGLREPVDGWYGTGAVEIVSGPSQRITEVAVH